MKRLSVAATVVLGLGCATSVSAAQYETCVHDLQFGHGLVAFVGRTPAEYAQAQRTASQWAGRRHVGLDPQTIAAVAINAPSGMVRQVQWIQPDNTAAVIDIR